MLMAALAIRAHAQATTGPAVVYALPGATELATVARGTTLAPGRSSGEYLRVNLRGYIASSLLGGKRDSFPVSVTGSGARLRGAPSATAPVLAELRQGTAFHVVKRAGDWTQVERAGWIRRSAFPETLAKQDLPKAAPPTRPEPRVTPKPGAAPSPPAAPAGPSARVTPPTAGRADTTPPPAGALTPSTSAELSPAPGVGGVATIRRGAVLTPIGRDRGWVRVSLEGWMRESDLVAADSSVSQISAADLRTNPDQYVGRTVRWAVTALAFQTADPLRKDMRPDEPYLLARGPGSENALLYLALPAELVDRARALEPMTQLVVTARVRTGRSDPSGVPILDVQSMTTK